MIESSDAQGNFTVQHKLTGCDTGRRNWAAYGSPSIQCKNHSATCCCRRKMKMYTSHQWIDVNNSSADHELRPDFRLETSVIKESVIRALLQRVWWERKPTVFTRLCTVLRVLGSMATLKATGCGSDVNKERIRLPEAPSTNGKSDHPMRKRLPHSLRRPHQRVCCSLTDAKVPSIGWWLDSILEPFLRLIDNDRPTARWEATKARHVI